MAGSRIERFSSIFSRIEGMIKAGALKYEDKPIWFNVYRVYPPKHIPTFTREPVPNENVVNMLYPEDLVRAKFYSLYGNPKTQVMTDLTDSETPTVCQRFVDKYFELKKVKRVSDEQLFETAVNYLKTEGVVLKTEEELQQELGQNDKTLGRKHFTSVTNSDIPIKVLPAREIFGERIGSSTMSDTEPEFEGSENYEDEDDKT